MANFPDLTRDGVVTRADVLKGRGVFKRGGKVKKVRKFQDGGETEFESKQGENPGISDDVRARAMKYVQEQNEPSSELVKEPPVAKTKAAPKPQPKAESKPAPKPAQKTESKKVSGEEPSFFKGTKGYKNLGALFKSMREKAGITSYKSGGKVSSASKRADGIAIRGKTRA